MGDKKKRRLAEAEACRSEQALMLAEGDDAAAEPDDEPAPEASTASTHPEEMRASVSLRLGKKVRLTATARATPAGLVACAILVSALTVPLIWIGRRR